MSARPVSGFAPCGAVPFAAGLMASGGRSFAEIHAKVWRVSSFPFQAHSDAVDCASIKTPERSSNPCVFFLLPFFPSRPLALPPARPARPASVAARVMVVVRPSVPLPARLRQTSLTRTPLRGRQSALAPVRWPTTRAFATDLTPAFERGIRNVQGPFGVIPRMAFSIAATGWPAGSRSFNSATRRVPRGSPFNIATRHVPRGGGEKPCSTRY